MEEFSSRLAKEIADSLGFDQEKEQVIAYGLVALIQMLSILAIISIIGFCFKLIFECLLIFMGVGLLRKATGGAHSNTMFGCMVISCINIAFLGIFSKYILIFPLPSCYYSIAYILIFSLCYYIIYKKAPVDSYKKRITSAKKIARLRKQSFITVTLYFILTILFIVLSDENLIYRSIANSICLLTLWQCFTLTSMGIKLLAHMDHNFVK